jgi:hypothetical protein
MAPSRNGAPPQRWHGLVTASLEAIREITEPPTGESTPPPIDGDQVDDLISKAAVAVDGHATVAQQSRLRMARLSADAAASLRSAIVGETPSVPGQPSKGITSGTRLDVQR